MMSEWDVSEFGNYMNSLLKRHFAQENGITPESVELRAAWRTTRFAYCVFSVMSTRGVAFVGMKMYLIPSTGGVSSEEDTAVKGWGEQLAGDPLVGILDYGSRDKIEWISDVGEGVPRYFSEIIELKSAGKCGAELYIPITALS